MVADLANMQSKTFSMHNHYGAPGFNSTVRSAGSKGKNSLSRVAKRSFYLRESTGHRRENTSFVTKGISSGFHLKLSDFDSQETLQL